ncbi:dioxygenase family protein [Streptomyces goshikiensis]|uniref:dioxygenase family protein n=1 Tax=Streptomyces goshikiensis TaxID=1942 RepID=UPI0036B37538
MEAGGDEGGGGEETRAARLVRALRDAVAEVVRDHGLTRGELRKGADILQDFHHASGISLATSLIPLVGSAFQSDEGELTPPDDPGPFFLNGAPLISNPGRVPMRPDEPGIPLVVSGYIRGDDGIPLAGAEVNIFMAANDTHDYSGMGRDEQPEWNLRARQPATVDGYYEFRLVTPEPYAIASVAMVHEVAASLGRSPYRPAHLHFVIRHERLMTDFATEVYFRGDPVIRSDALGPEYASPRLRTDLVLHTDPEETAHPKGAPFHTAVFDFRLRTRTGTLG